MKQIGFNSNIQDAPVVKTPWLDHYDQKTTIFGKHTFLPIDFDRALNDNTLVIGTSGTGKTYSFVEPNVLQGNSNYVIADAKGNILAETGSSLKKMGYNIQVLNLVDPKHSMTFNPLSNMNNQLDVVNFANQVLATKVSGQVVNNTREDPFWNNAATSLLEALIFFVQENLPEEEQTMGTVTRLFNIMMQKPDQINTALSQLGEVLGNYYFDGYSSSNTDDPRKIGDYLFAWVRENDPDSYALKMWDKVISIAGASRTWSCVVGILGSALTAYSLREVENLLSSNQLDFSKMLQPKNALFIIYDDADSSKNFISNVLYSQLIRFLYHEAFKCKGQKLPFKVRFYLDDFKNINIPEFDDYLATARSRNISFCMMLQDESQLQAKFGANTSSVIGNCGAYLLTGTTDLNMAEIASHRFNRDSQAIRLMDKNHFLLDVGGNLTSPIRYDFHDHPNFDGKRFNLQETFNTPTIEQETHSWSHLREILKYLPDERNTADDMNGIMTAF